MSAFLCNSKHFAALAVFAVNGAHHSHVINEWRNGNSLDECIRIAGELAKENIRSVSSRYPQDNAPAGTIDLGDRLAIKEAQAQAEKYYFNPPRVSLVDILKMCQCLEYQSCETPDWRDTLACRQLEWIRGAAIRRLPGYDASPWDYHGEKDTAA